MWANVNAKHLEVHERGDTFAEVTEGTRVLGLFWERSRYNWSQPGVVKATVIDSNIFEPGSTWELRARPGNGGSEVTMLYARRFRKGAKGRIVKMLYCAGGPRLFRWYLRRALTAVEKKAA